MRTAVLCRTHLSSPSRTSASHSVGPPVQSAEVSGLGRPHHQVLHVPPGQVHAAQTRTNSAGITSLVYNSLRSEKRRHILADVKRQDGSGGELERSCERGNVRSLVTRLKCKPNWSASRPALMKYTTQTGRRPRGDRCASQPPPLQQHWSSMWQSYIISHVLKCQRRTVR